MPTSSAFSRAARTSSVNSPTCLLAFLNCLPALPTCLARRSAASRARHGDAEDLLRLLAETCAEDGASDQPGCCGSDARMTAAFDDPFPFDARALPPLDDFRALVPELREPELRLPLRETPTRSCDSMRWQSWACSVKRCPCCSTRCGSCRSMKCCGSYCSKQLRLFGLDPFELRELACRLLVEPVLAWATAPP